MSVIYHTVKGVVTPTKVVKVIGVFWPAVRKLRVRSPELTYDVAMKAAKTTTWECKRGRNPYIFQRPKTKVATKGVALLKQIVKGLVEGSGAVTLEVNISDISQLEESESTSASADDILTEIPVDPRPASARKREGHSHLQDEDPKRVFTPVKLVFSTKEEEVTKIVKEENTEYSNCFSPFTLNSFCSRRVFNITDEDEDCETQSPVEEFLKASAARAAILLYEKGIHDHLRIEGILALMKTSFTLEEEELFNNLWSQASGDSLAAGLELGLMLKNRVKAVE